jgi:hypothetical protein
MDTTDPVRRVSVVSTGQVQIRPDHEASNWRPMAWWLLASRSWTGPRPINAYVIEHRHGLVLFDTGQDRASVTDPGYFPKRGGRGAVRPPGQVRDRHRIAPEPADDPGLAPFRSAHDLFGDGSLVLLPTPGHTPGSLSLLVRRPGLAPLLMVGDLSYDAHLLEAGHVPGVGSRRRLREATALVNRLRRQYPELVILPAHDPGAAARLAQATASAPHPHVTQPSK